jgi:hypothetical protein
VSAGGRKSSQQRSCREEILVPPTTAGKIAAGIAGVTSWAGHSPTTTPYPEFITDDPASALEHLALISLLLRRLDTASVRPAANA